MNDILHIAITLEQFWHRVPGGTAVSIWELARSLADRELEMTGVAAWHKTRPPRRFRLDLPIEWLPMPRALLYESWHRLRMPKVQLATGRVDVIHATTLAMPPKTAPLVVTIHDLAFLRAPEHFTTRGNRFFRKGLDLALRDADIVVCPSQATAADCIEHGFNRNRVRVAPWGVSPDTASDAEITEARDRLGLDSPYLLWTGTVEPRKNLPRLVEAFLSMDTDLKLVLAGPEGWNEDLAPLLERAGSRVVALGFLDPGELRAVYAGAEVFCYPSLSEGFGLPVLEAMAQGTPVVTALGTATEEAAGGAAVLVDPTDPAAIAGGIAEALGHRDPLAEAGRRRAAQMTWVNCAQQMHAIYAEATG